MTPDRNAASAPCGYSFEKRLPFTTHLIYTLASAARRSDSIAVCPYSLSSSNTDRHLARLTAGHKRLRSVRLLRKTLAGKIIPFSKSFSARRVGLVLCPFRENQESKRSASRYLLTASNPPGIVLSPARNLADSGVGFREARSFFPVENR
jgi:hypothetical protein